MKWLLSLALAAAACAQPFSAGIKVGAPITDAFNIATGKTNFSAGTQRFTIGPTAELKLPFGFGIEVDALYRHLEYNYASSAVSLNGDIISAGTKASSWEFPILAKYRAPIPLVKPYLVGGLAFNRITGIKQTLACVGGACSRPFNDIAHNSNVGIVLGTGLQVNALLLKISPEIRYTRWGFANFDASGALGSTLRSNQNQAEVLVGFTF